MTEDRALFTPSPETCRKIATTPGRVGLSLGLKIDSRENMIHQVREGLDVSVVSYLSKAMQLPEKEIAQLAAIPFRTLSRRKKEGRLHSDESDRIARVAMVFDEVVELFNGDQGQAAHWFHSPKTALGGATPVEYADTEIGIQEIRDLIGRLRHGVFS